MLGRRHAGAALAVLALWGCNAGPNNGSAASSSAAGAGTASGPIAGPLVAGTTSGSTGGSGTGSAGGGSAGSGSGGSTGSGAGGATASSAPSSHAWMTEAEEVAWMNSIGFNVTIADLRASYSRFVPVAINASTNVLWGTESDDLRNYYRLYKRTGYAGFLAQAQNWHDFQVNVYAQWQNGGTNVVEPEHVYMMGLVDWYVDHQDQPTLDAINRIIDFIKTVKGDPFYETRVSARCLQCLCYYMEKIGTRASEVNAKIQELVTGLKNAKVAQGLTVMHFAVGTGFTVDNKPASIDLTQKFPKDTAAAVVTGHDTYDVKGFDGAGVYQDCMLMHALHVAGRVLGDTSLHTFADRIAGAWVPHVVAPFWDTTGQYALTVPYYLLTGAPELDLFHYPGKSTPLYVTQYSAFCPDAAKKTALQQQALLRAFGEIDAVKASELGGKPRYFLWETWEQGFFLTQK